MNKPKKKKYHLFHLLFSRRRIVKVKFSFARENIQKSDDRRLGRPTGRGQPEKITSPAKTKMHNVKTEHRKTLIFRD